MRLEEPRLQPFEKYFSGYLSAIREAKGKGASHDHLRHLFLDFALSVVK